jgi:hypothetical protein
LKAALEGIPAIKDVVVNCPANEVDAEQMEISETSLHAPSSLQRVFSKNSSAKGNSLHGDDAAAKVGIPQQAQSHDQPPRPSPTATRPQ